MAIKIAIANGNWNTAATWGSNTNTPTFHSGTGLTLSASNRFTATFTAPNTTNAVKGVLMYFSTVGIATINVWLQESTVDTAATVSLAVNQGSISGSNTWIYLEFPTPYTFTTTAAGAYRFRITATSITTTPVVRADSGATLPAFLAVDDRTGVPASTDVPYIPKTVTVDGARTCGNGGDTTTLGANAPASITLGLQVVQGGKLTFDPTINTSLTVSGNFCVSGTGEYEQGTVATPINSGVTSELIIDQTVSPNYGFQAMPTAKWTQQGLPKTYISTKYASGSGTTLSPLITNDAVDWAVNDRIVIAGNVYNQYETKYIKTKNSATSYVLSDTAGGVESGFANSHSTTNPIVNTTMNVIVRTTSSAQNWYGVVGGGDSTKVNIDWVEFRNGGVAGTASRQGLVISNNGAGTANTYASVDNCVFYDSIFAGLAIQNSLTAQTHTNLWAINSTRTANPTTGAAFCFLANCANKTLTNCGVINYGIPGIFMSTPVACTFNNFECWDTNSANSASVGGVYFSGTVTPTFNSCTFQANRNAGIYFANCTRATFNTCLFGNSGSNTTDIITGSGSTNIECHFDQPTLSSATTISGYATQGSGSKITMTSVNGTTDDHRTYEDTGTTRSTGAGLADTNVNTSGSLAWRIAPENNTTGMVKTFLVLARPNQYVTVSGRIQKNAAFGSSTCTVEIILPGSTTAAASYTMPSDTNWNVFNIAASYSGSRNAYATVRITAISSTASAYVYVDDLYNGTNAIIALDVWYRGEPSTIMFEQLGDASAVWAVTTASQVTSGTMGYLVTKLLTVAKFIGLK